VALGAAFLNGIASRFGLYGKNRGYGNYANYLKYAGEVNSFMPTKMVPFLAHSATAMELTLGILLVLGG
jgi:putative oxidoreductase